MQNSFINKPTNLQSVFSGSGLHSISSLLNQSNFGNAIDQNNMLNSFSSSNGGLSPIAGMPNTYGIEVLGGGVLFPHTVGPDGNLMCFPCDKPGCCGNSSNPSSCINGCCRFVTPWCASHDLMCDLFPSGPGCNIVGV